MTDADRCGALRRDGSGHTCRQPAGWGTDHLGAGRCKLHGGNTRNHRTAGRLALASRAASEFGVPIETTAPRALANELNRANGIVAYLTARCQELTPAELTGGIAEIRNGPDGTTTVFRSAPNVNLVLLKQWSDHVAEVAAVMARLDLSAQELGVAQAFAVALDRALTRAGVPLGARVETLRLLPGELDAAGA
jgi:hypothetical protein